MAKATGLPLIDLNTPLYSRPDLLADAIHPNAEGAKIIAEAVYGALTGNYGGLCCLTVVHGWYGCSARQTYCFPWNS